MGATLPDYLMAALSVPIFRSFAPQSGITVPRLVAGFTHFRWEPGERTGSSSQPSASSLRATSRYFKPQPPLLRQGTSHE